MRINEIHLQDDTLRTYIDKNLNGILDQVFVDGKGSIFFDVEKQETLDMCLIAIVNWWKQVIAYSQNRLVDELEVQNFTEDDFTFALALLLLLLEEFVLEEEDNSVMYWEQDSDFQRNFRKDGYKEVVNFISDIKMVFKMVFLIADRSHISCLLDERWLCIWRYLGLTIGSTLTPSGEIQYYSIQGSDTDYGIIWH